ncbi:MAG: hypothetical protein QW139_02795, partial [Candidatus Micrarchaeaceae archaeon]
DLLIIRSQYEGAAKLAADLCTHPIINAGDGSQQHPTQAMIDLYTLIKMKGNIENQSIGLFGDLKYGRAATSFMYALGIFGVKQITAIAPEALMPRTEVIKELGRLGVDVKFSNSIEQEIGNLDVIYVTRIQKERFPDVSEYEKVRGVYKLTLPNIAFAKEGMIIMHPLPRVDELDVEIDKTEHAAYFNEAANGIPIRMALMSIISGVLNG